ncbi:MAG: TatD family hydrolase [Candidatus Micrarchaeia archaeon]
MIDAHCHLMDMGDYDVKGCKLEKIANCSYDLESSLRAISMKKEFYDKLYCVIGVSPQKCMLDRNIWQVNELQKIIENEYVVDGIGEIGLDFYWAGDELKKRMQREGFMRQIAIAEELEKPLVIHSRNAVKECIDMLSKFDYGVMFHFYSGSVNDAMEIIDRGWYISIPPVKGKERKKVIESVNISNLVAETDAPYVGKTPDDVIRSISIIAEVKQMMEREVEIITSRNVLDFFRCSS